MTILENIHTEKPDIGKISNLKDGFLTNLNELL